MKRTRYPEPSGSRSSLTLLIGFAALTVLILLAALPASCVSRYRVDYVAGSEAGSSVASPTTRPQTTHPQAIRPLGTRPAHLRTDPVTAVPNQQAIKAALWAPGIDHGYVPQGLAFAEGQILMSGYRSTSPAIFMGPCRVYRVDPASGGITGYFDLPPACGHAGGLAYAGGGVLILSDTRRLYRINLELALREQQADNAITGTLDLGGTLRGSFVTIVPVTIVPVTIVPVTIVPVTIVPVTIVPAAFVPATAWPGILLGNQPGHQPGDKPGNQPGDKPATGARNEPGMFIGAWSTSANKARGYFLPLSLFDSHSGTTITETNAIHSIPLAARAQGAAFAPDGSFWLSYSSHDFGRVERVDPSSGQILASYPLVSGTEDISFDELGKLWAVSEAGSLRWRTWRTSFPLMFSLDTALLE